MFSYLGFMQKYRNMLIWPVDQSLINHKKYSIFLNHLFLLISLFMFLVNRVLLVCTSQSALFYNIVIRFRQKKSADIVNTFSIKLYTIMTVWGFNFCNRNECHDSVFIVSVITNPRLLLGRWVGSTQEKIGRGVPLRPSNP